MLSWVLPFFALALGAEAPAVRTEFEVGLPCSLDATLPPALQQLEVKIAADGDPTTWILSARRDTEVIELRVFDSTRTLRGARRLASTDADCPSLARAAALLVRSWLLAQLGAPATQPEVTSPAVPAAATPVRPKARPPPSSPTRAVPPRRDDTPDGGPQIIPVAEPTPAAAKIVSPFNEPKVAFVAPEPVDSGDDHSTAVFVAPLTVLSGAAIAPITHSKPLVFVVLGGNFTASNIEWSIDTAVVQRDPDGSPSPVILANGTRRQTTGMLGYAGGWLSCGPVFRTGTRALQGFFVSPKVTLGTFLIGRDGRDAILVDVMVGADVGYQLTRGHFYFAVLLGASLGVGFGEDDLWAGPLSTGPFAFPTAGFSFALGLNLQLVRIGFSF